jgi:asparagine synthase (glutamine-hydrolysing)
MCGLFGWLKFDAVLTDGEIQLSRLATAKIAHRGPDGSGEWFRGGVFMGHRRLKILDLSEKSAQPFKSQDGRYVLTYNGEIYNYIELREELKQLGFRFETTSDTEVFLSAFQAWGVDAFVRFEGMFAAAIIWGKSLSITSSMAGSLLMLLSFVVCWHLTVSTGPLIGRISSAT